MFKRLLLLVLPLVVLSGFIARPVEAGPSDTAYIVLRCTVTLSVTVLSPATYYFNEVSAAATYYSDAPITFRNNSKGAICRWDLHIDEASLEGWTLANVPGLNQVALLGLFKPDQPEHGDFHVSVDTLSITAKEYNSTNFHHPDYNDEGFGNDASKILPHAYASTVGKSADRKLWLKLQTPLCVTDQNWRTLRLIVTAKMAGN